MKSIAVFGANGYLGSHLCRHFADYGANCSRFDVQTRGQDALSDGFVHCDVTDPAWWDSFDPAPFSSILFMSGLSGPERSFRDAPVYESVNVGGLLLLLRKLADMGESAPKIVFPSSRLVYRGGGVVDEDSPLEPRSVYAANKVACEGLLSAYHHRYGIRYAALRICVPYGNLISSDYSYYGTLGIFMRQVLSGQPITIYGDGRCKKTYTHVNDVCDIFRRVAECSAAVGVFNVGGHDYTLREVADAVLQSHKGSVRFVPWPKEALLVEMGDITLNATRLSRVIGRVDYRRMEDSLADL